MNKIFTSIVNNRKKVTLVFLLLTVLCAILSTAVGVNYDFADYLPETSPSTEAYKVMNGEFTAGYPNARVMVEDITLVDALEMKKAISAVDGVSMVLWLDDVVNIREPLEIADKDVTEAYYKDGKALFSVAITGEDVVAVVQNVRSACGGRAYLSGTAVNTADATQATGTELGKIILFVIPLCFIILLLTTSSWFEGVLFMVTIGVAIVLNAGTNIIFGEISFVTNASGSILQLAVSMDYSIFLLHRFSDYRSSGSAPKDAMLAALNSTFSSVLASGITTAIGFAALILMDFRLGQDMGVVMAKSILFSLITVFALLPVLTLSCYKLIDKTMHKELIPKFTHFARFLPKIRYIAAALFALLILPSFLAQQSNSFTYGASEIFGDGTENYEQRTSIEKTFGKANVLVLLVPNGNYGAEVKLVSDLKKLNGVLAVTSYVESAGIQIPAEMVDPSLVSQLISDNYSRMLLTLNSDSEGNEAFRLVEEIRSCASAYYNENHLVGDSVITYDMKNVVTGDMLKVNLIAVISIFIVLIATMRSVKLPLFLVIVIEASIWINLSVPYFSGSPVFYIAYLIISTIQLGATVDYAILIATRYREERKTRCSSEALYETISNSTLSVLTSASILTLGGASIGVISSMEMLSQLGMLVARGAVISAAMVLLVLPSLLVLFDRRK